MKSNQFFISLFIIIILIGAGILTHLEHSSGYAIGGLLAAIILFCTAGENGVWE